MDSGDKQGNLQKFKLRGFFAKLPGLKMNKKCPNKRQNQYIYIYIHIYIHNLSKVLMTQWS